MDFGQAIAELKTGKKLQRAGWNGGLNMDFGQAIAELKTGKKLQRAGWNGKGMWLRYVDLRLFGMFSNWLPFIVMKTADDKIVPWFASQTDILATDWQVVDAEELTHDDDDG